MILWCKGLRLTVIKEIAEYISLKNLHLIGICTSAHQILIGHLNLVDHSLLIALSIVAMETEFVIQLPPSTTSVFAVIKAEAPLTRKSTLSATSWRETSLCKGTFSMKFGGRCLPPVKMQYSYGSFQT